MSTTTAEPPITPISREESYALAQVAVARELEVLRSLSPEDWERPTSCPAWTVRQVVIHQVTTGMSFLSPVDGIRQLRAGKRLEQSEGLPSLDAFTQAGQRRRDGWSWEEALERFTEGAPRFARLRRRFPRPLRSLLRVPTNDGKVGLGYLFDRVINRDLLMHRVDICDATGTALLVTADHEGRLVADLVAEWADLHGRPFVLELTGPAGGRWSRGQGGESVVLDAIEFARVLSGRGEGMGLMATSVMF